VISSGESSDKRSDHRTIAVLPARCGGFPLSCGRVCTACSAGVFRRDVRATVLVRGGDGGNNNRRDDRPQLVWRSFASVNVMENLPLGVIARYPLAGRLERYEVVLTRSAMRFFPGSSTPVHSHPGIVMGYVLEGRVRFAIDDQPERIVPAGGTFFEPLGAVHTTSGSTSAGEATTILVFELRPRELPPTWETLVRELLPADIEPVISVNGLTMPEQPVAEHSHAGPVIGYVVDGEIENQIDPDPAAIYKAGGVFYEPPRHLHKIMRTASAAPAKLLIFHAGRAGVPDSLLRPLPDV